MAILSKKLILIMNLSFMDYLDDFDAIAKAQNDRKRELDRDDLNRELAGVDVGRLPRFLSSEARERLQDAKNGQSRAERWMSALDFILMNDPDYARVYEGAMDALVSAENAVDRALEKSMARSTATQLALVRTLDKAMKLPDGTVVFMDAAGAVRDKAGHTLDADLTSTLEWQGNEPTYETYREQRDALENSREAVSAIRGDQLELGEIREELSDHDNPPSKERVEELADRSREIEAIYEIGTELTPIDQSQTISVAKPDLSGF